MNTVTINLYENTAANLKIDVVAYLFQKPSANAVNQSLRDMVYESKSNLNGNDIDNLNAKVTPFIRLTYALPADANGNYVKADWKNTMHLTYHHMQNLKTTLNQLKDALADPEAFVLNNEGTQYFVSEKYANSVYGFAKDGQNMITGRLHVVSYAVVEPGTNIERTVCVPGVALMLQCGNGNANLFTIEEFKVIYEILTSVNLVDMSVYFTMMRYMDIANNKINVGRVSSTTGYTKQPQRTQSAYGQNTNVYGQGTPAVNTTMPAYGRVSQPAQTTQQYVKPNQPKQQYAEPAQTYGSTLPNRQNNVNTAPVQSGANPFAGINKQAAATQQYSAPASVVNESEETINSLDDLPGYTNDVYDDGLDDIDVDNI